MSFLKSLAELDSVYDSGKNTEKRQTRGHKAAAGLFNWEEDIFVARAPGRLDVMGGIADYSGSLVLQMPIREACHVAVQRNHPSKHRLWKHAQARQNAKGQGPTPVLQIVSSGSELSNRGPTFDMDISDFMDGDKPISYEKARKYFAQDPSQKWAAYVAGAILVLMTELDVCFEDSISMLVSSAVPEGKGVSSSASVEVASMTAIAAAHGLNISPRDMALLCQKVENHIVGAPCGVMDQMTSVCGEANKLLAMVCQPAEVICLVEIASHIRFWGIDSGIRHRPSKHYYPLQLHMNNLQLLENSCIRGSTYGPPITLLAKSIHDHLYTSDAILDILVDIICVIGRNCLHSSQQIIEIQQRYKGGTGYLPFLFEGSSPGAAEFGYLKIRRQISF